MTTPSLRSNAPGRSIQTTVNELTRRLENKATVTLATGTTETILRDPRLYETSLVVLVPLTAAAAASVAAGTCFVSSYRKGALTITHAAGSGDRRFGLVIH